MEKETLPNNRQGGLCFFTNGSLSKLEAAGRDIKYPCVVTIINTGSSVCHDEILFRVGVPRPKGIAAFHQVIKDQSLSWIDTVGAIAAFPLGCGLIEINRERNGCLCCIADPDFDRVAH